jgi:hypothetical protein
MMMMVMINLKCWFVSVKTIEYVDAVLIK